MPRLRMEPEFQAQRINAEQKGTIESIIWIEQGEAMETKNMDDWTCLAGECRIRTWPSLHEMSQVIIESADLSHTVKILLRLMEKNMNVVRVQ
jgi:hypothetical protein